MNKHVFTPFFIYLEQAFLRSEKVQICPVCAFLDVKGRVLVLTILLADRDEAIFVYEKLLIQSVTFRYMTVKLVDDYCIAIDCRKNKHMSIQKVVIPVLVDMVTQVKEKRIIDTLLREKFFFTDRAEREEIMKIVYVIMREGHPMLQDSFFLNRKKIISKALQNFFFQIPSSFSLDAFLQFRLRAYEDYLLEVTEYAIDEYKLEQEYQGFIENLRKNINESQGSVAVIHVYHSQTFTLYNEQKEWIATYTEKEKIIDMLVQLAPKMICLYTRFIDHQIVVTLLNIFQESVTLKHLHEFKLHEKADN